MVLHPSNKVYGIRFIQEIEDLDTLETIMNIVYEVSYEDEMTKEHLAEVKRIYDCIENKQYYRFYYYTECTTTADMDLGNDGYFMAWMPISKTELEKLIL
jgi:predicted hydrocarbon binding protein